MIDRRARFGVVDAGHHRLARAYVHAAGAQARDQRAREDRLADPGVGGGDEAAAERLVLPARTPGANQYAARATGSATLAAGSNVTPTSRAATLSAATAPASSVAVWEAITVSRRRELPAGTVGGRIACAKTP